MSTENQLHGKNLEGSEQEDAIDSTKFAKKRSADTELHLDDEKDTLYEDGLEVEDDSEKLADTHSQRHTGG